MVIKLSKSLPEWLNKTVKNLNYSPGRRVVVISVFGKETAEILKTQCINDFLEMDAFSYECSWTNAQSSIEAYFCKAFSTLFLCFNGYGDMKSIENIFADNSTVSEGFFDRLSQSENDHLRHLLFASIISHGIVFVEPCSRFDLNICRYLMKANQLRLSSREKICEQMSLISDFPVSWATEGRLATPYVYFAYYRNMTRIDSNKKGGSWNHYELNMEKQISYLFRHYKLIGGSQCYNCCAILPSRVRFVHHFSSNEAKVDSLFDVLKLFTTRDVKCDEGIVNQFTIPRSFFTLEKCCYEESSDSDSDNAGHDVSEFLRNIIERIHKGRDQNIIYELPEFKWLVRGMQLVCDLIFEKKVVTDQYIYEKCNVEIRFSKSVTSKHLVTAILNYNTRDLEGNEAIVYSKATHEAKLKKAIENLEFFYHGTNLKSVKDELIRKCDAIWQLHKSCEAVSLMGNSCVLPIHHSPSDLNISACKRFLHSSNVQFRSACNCGYSQSYRNDPFTLKEANFDFYASFDCCKRLEQYDFMLFEEKDYQNLFIEEEKVSPRISESVSDELSNHLMGQSFDEGFEMLMDRDNSLEMEEIVENRLNLDQKEDTEANEISGESAEHDSRSLEDLGNALSQEDLISHRKHDESMFAANEDNEPNTELIADFDEIMMDGNEEEKSIVYNDDVDDDGDDGDIDGDNICFSTSLEKLLSTSQELSNMEPVSTTKSCYLDEAGAQKSYCFFDGAAPQLSKQSESMRAIAIEFEERIAKLRRCYKGKFLECVPNTSSIAKPPLFPSWSLVCLGSASLYSRKIGLRDMPNFTSGLHYLIPIDFYLTVNREKWEEDMKMIGGISRRLRKTTCENTRERVKLFIGFEFECLRGHRFIFGQKHLSNKMDSTSKLINLDIPLWLKCRCRRSSYAQLMRLHIVTPKAPVTVFINPRVQQSRSTIFHTGEKPIGLEYSRYYVMRFPYIFGGSHGILRRQNDDYKMAKLLANSISVIHSPLN